MAIQFKELVKHGRLAFAPGPKYGFENPDAATYFKNAGWAEDAEGEHDVWIAADSIEIDHDAIFADGPKKGLKIMGA